MVETTILWLAGDTPESVSWAHVGAMAEPAAQVHQGKLAEAAAEIGMRRVVVLVPAVNLLLTSVMIPTRNRQRLLAAVPNVLEDSLAADIDDLHFAIGQHGTDGRVNVAVVSKAQMNAWLTQLQDAGIRPAILAPDVLALPYVTGDWMLCETGNYGLVRTGESSGFAGDLDNLPLLLHAALEEAGDFKPDRICVYREADVIKSGEFDIEFLQFHEPALQAMARAFDEKQLLNLLQGDFSRREQFGKAWRPWRATAALLLVWLVFHVGMTITDYIRLASEDSELRASIEQSYRAAFPDSRIVNPRAQMEQGLKALREGKGAGDSALLTLLAEIGKPLAETGGLELQRLSYRDGQIDLALTIKDLQNLDQLKQQLAAQPGVAVEIQSASARDNQVEARLQIRNKPS